jgi:hypothetical protein
MSPLSRSALRPSPYHAAPSITVLAVTAVTAGAVAASLDAAPIAASLIAFWHDVAGPAYLAAFRAGLAGCF